MGVFDVLFDAAAALVDATVDAVEAGGEIVAAIGDPDLVSEGATDLFTQTVDDAEPVTEVAGALVEVVESQVTADIREEGALTPENVEAAVNGAEGSAVSVLAGFAASSSFAEIAGLGQLDTQAEFLTQALAGLGVEDVTGMELEARIAEGVKPALNAKVGKEHRAKFVNLPDAVEYLLRAKTADTGWITGDEQLGAERAVIGSNEPVNPDNPLEEWGIRDDQLQILERVSLEAVEIEELIESPVQFGVVPTPEEAETVLQISGLPEDAKDLFRRTIAQAPRAADLWEQRTTTGDLVTELDSLVLDGEITTDQALIFLPPEITEARDALRERWDLLEAIPPGRPSQTDFEGAFGRGYIPRQTLEARIAESEFDPDRYEGVVKSVILDELDGDLQESVALGLLSENEFSNLAQHVGLDQDTTNKLLQGQSLSDITKARLEEATPITQRSVTTIQGIGESRALSLEAIGIETLDDLARADPSDVSDITNVALEIAEDWVQVAGEVS